MARLAIFIDGGYLNALAEKSYRVWIDYTKFPEEVRKIVAAKTPEPLDLLRTYFYDCLPYQSNPAKADEAERFAQKRRFFQFLGS